jgi:lysophospholipase L1-like esterase
MKPTGPEQWEKQIAEYEQLDKVNPPLKGGIVFLGGGVLRMWTTLDQDFKDHRVINRGFGGSLISDYTHFADRIIIPYEPKMIFVRGGGNDINRGKSPEEVLADYKAFVAKIHEKLPQTEIVFISMNPSPKRWSEREANKVGNQLIEEYSKSSPLLKYVETYDMTLKPDGTPRDELFSDGLHFSAEGYRLLVERLRPFMPKK